MTNPVVIKNPVPVTMPKTIVALPEAVVSVPQNVNNAPVKYTTPNGKIYTIFTLSDTTYIFERPDGSGSSKKFTAYQDLVNFLDNNNQKNQLIGSHTAQIGRAHV